MPKTVRWKSASNKFATKHLCVIGQALSVMELYTRGKAVFDARQLAAVKKNSVLNAMSDAEYNKHLAAKATYGPAKPPINTMVVVSIGGLQAMAAEVLEKGAGHQTLAVRGGVIFAAKDGFHEEGTGGSITVTVNAVGPDVLEVVHLAGYAIGSKLPSVGATTAGQLKVQSFMPSVEDLQAAKNSLGPDWSDAFQKLFGA